MADCNIDKQHIYGLLEDKFIKYEELLGIGVQDNQEQMINLQDHHFFCISADGNILKTVSTSFYARETVMNRLLLAQNTLSEYRKDLKIAVVEAYRSLNQQNQAYNKIRNQLGYVNDLSTEAKEKIHRFIAIPEVSGHPTGGAVDVVLVGKDKKTIYMGTEVHEFTEDSYVFSPFIDRKAYFNRQLLRTCMIKAGFAPFDGEWWHFSYGDREWAKYYNKTYAIYSQINLGEET